MNKQYSLIEKLNKIDNHTDNRYNLKTLYESVELTTEKKQRLSEMVNKHEPAKTIYTYLMEAFDSNFSDNSDDNSPSDDFNDVEFYRGVVNKSDVELPQYSDDSKELVIESIDPDDSYSVNDLLDGMFGNMDDVSFDSQQRDFNRYAKVLRSNRRMMRAISDPENEYAPSNYFNDFAKVGEAKFYDDYTTGLEDVVEEVVNGTTWLFFKDETALKNYITAVDHKNSLGESFNNRGYKKPGYYEFTFATSEPISTNNEHVKGETVTTEPYPMIYIESEKDFDNYINKMERRSDIGHFISAELKDTPYNEDLDYDDEEDDEDTVPVKKSVDTEKDNVKSALAKYKDSSNYCDKCGTRLTDGKQCPICDLGEEDY